MLDQARKQRLAEHFFDDGEFFSDLTAEEEQYLAYLSEKWSKSLLELYEKIIRQDRYTHQA